jgi:hypothetical protein
MSQYQSDISDEAGLALAFFAPSAPLIPGNRTPLCTLVDHTRTNRLADHKPPQVMPDCACK